MLNVTSCKQPRVIGHVVALDSIHRIQLIKSLQRDTLAHVLDLDLHQLRVYNSIGAVKLREQFKAVSSDVNSARKQLKLVNNRSTQRRLDTLREKLRTTRIKMQQLWYESMLEFITNTLDENDGCDILYVGSNVYPNDCRVSIDLKLPETSVKLVAEYDSNVYAANQIKYYLLTQSKRITSGEFSLNSLRVDYLTNAYHKFVDRYEKSGYTLCPYDRILETIRARVHNLSVTFEPESDRLEVSLVQSAPSKTVSTVGGSQSKRSLSLSDARTGDIESRISLRLSDTKKRVMFVALLYKSNGTIVVTKDKPIRGYASREEALGALKKRLKKRAPIYVYELDACQFEFVNGKYLARDELVVSEIETVVLTGR